MKQKTARLMALLLAALMVLTACGGGGKDTGNGGESTPPVGDGGGETTPGQPEGSKGEPIKDLVTYQTQANEMETFLIFYNDTTSTLDVLSNCLSFLVEVDTQGKLVPGIAKEWGTDDNGLTWTFCLRDDVTWVDVDGNEKAKCVSQDWCTAMEWMLNFHKNDAVNSTLLRQMVKGAEEYFQTVKDMDKDAALALKATDDLFKNTVGIETPDDYTIVYHCSKNVPYFDSMGASTAMLPLSQAQVDELGVEGLRAQDNTTMWYNGPYRITEFVQNNSKVLTKNDAYWDKDCTLFDTVTVLMVDDPLNAQTMFMNGELDTCTLSESNLRTIYDNPDHEWHDYLVENRTPKHSYQIHFNFVKNNPDGTPDTNWNNAVANEAFRKSLYYGLDLTNYWKRTNFINPTGCENLTFTKRGLCYFSDGREYTTRVMELLDLDYGERYNAELAQQYKEQAMQELAGKVEFPIQIDHYISGSNQSALDGATVIKEIVEALGTDYVQLNIQTYTSSARQEVYVPRLHSWNFGNGWGGDYADPETFMLQMLYGVEGAYYVENYNNANDITDPVLLEQYTTFTKMAQDASNVFDSLDNRYEAYAQAEAYLLDHALVIPCHHSISWQLTKVNDYSKMYAMFGRFNGVYKNWETSTEGYTTEQYEQFKNAAQ